MTNVTLLCDKAGCFKAFNAEGHAGFAGKGSDIVCAAVTVLLRTALQLLSDSDGITIDAEVAEAGKLSVEVTHANPGTEQRLVCIADFLRTGIRSVMSDYPQFVKLREETEKITAAEAV
ncbi:MAG: ribosomal-processing cysteine protease Prp [Treponema sp.]|nr:ribosomal-processing cysteine protease Prp [Treponema sp.]